MFHNEAEKIFMRVRPFLEGKTVVDLGCGSRRVAPWAIGVDDESESTIIQDTHVKASIDPAEKQLPKFIAEGGVDVVFSSHALEHIPGPLEDTIRYWASFVKPGGRLVLYLPDEDRYRYDPKNPTVKNPQHVHLLTPKAFRKVIDQIRELDVEVFEEDPQIFDRYSFLVVCKKWPS